MRSPYLREDAGLIVIGWITKLAAALAVVGLIAFDGFSIVASKFSTSDHADTYASDAADYYHGLIRTQSAAQAVNAAYARAEQEAKAKGDNIDPKSFSIAPTGNVTLVVTHTAKSIWLHRVDGLKKYLLITETGTGSPPSS